MKNGKYQDKVVWIIGASSGIGAALAKELSKRGARLALSARNQQALENLSASLESDHRFFPSDVTDAVLMIKTAQTIHTVFGCIDQVIFLAASYIPMKMDALDLGISRQMIETNVLGALHMLHAVLPILKDQPQGQIALCGSVAGYIGLPGGQPYSATKSAMINLAESLYVELQGKVDVKLINPGFVRTHLTDKNDFDMPMIISPEQAAVYIADGLLSKRFEVHFPRRFTIWLKLLRLFPYRLAFKITKRFK